VGFKPTIPASEQAKIVHALDRSATVTGDVTLENYLIKEGKSKGVHVTGREGP
jgi:hypothetical protein